MIAHDAAKYGALSVFAAHLHAHDSCTRFVVATSGGAEAETLGVLAAIETYTGYGANQTFMHLEPEGRRERRLRPGDSLTIECTFDTTMRSTMTEYGVGHGEEMCGPLLIYYPTDAGSSFADHSWLMQRLT